MTVNVLIADDHPPTRAGVRHALEQSGRFTVCAEVSNAPAAIETAMRLQPELALLDIRMPGDGILAASAIADRCPNTSVVMLTVSRDDADLFAAVRSGAKGYLLKDIDPDRLPLALDGVLAGEAALPRGLVARLVDEFHSRGRPRRARALRISHLTDREWDVLRLMQRGKSTTEMAMALTVTEVTIRTHVSSILRKLQVRDRQAAVELAARERDTTVM